MGVVVSSSLVLSESPSGGGVITADNPIIGYKNLITTLNISSTTEDTDYPATNLANPSTNLHWEGLTASPEEDEYITMALNTAELVDYVGIAKHNFYSDQIEVSLEVLNDDSPAGWDEIVSGVIPSSDGPLLFRFTPQAVTSIRIRMRPGDAAPQVAVVYAGALLVVQRRIYVGHTPITYGRNTNVVNAMSESGNFLGRVVLNETRGTNISFENLTADWYRTYFEPFVAACNEIPFFFAWRPDAYPNEVGYLWLTEDPQPNNSLPNGMMAVSLKVNGIR